MTYWASCSSIVLKLWSPNFEGVRDVIQRESIQWTRANHVGLAGVRSSKLRGTWWEQITNAILRSRLECACTWLMSFLFVSKKLVTEHNFITWKIGEMEAEIINNVDFEVLISNAWRTGFLWNTEHFAESTHEHLERPSKQAYYFTVSIEKCLDRARNLLQRYGTLSTAKNRASVNFHGILFSFKICWKKE